MANQKTQIAVLGGTGNLGSGLAWRLLRAGYPVVIGSRSAEKAEAAASALAERAGGNARVTGLANAAAAETADLVMLTVPFASQMATLESVRDPLQGKILVDATVPLVPPKVMRVQLPEGGSAAKNAQTWLGDGVRVVSAFQNVAASHLATDEDRIDQCDVLVAGNDKEAREVVVQLCNELGMTAWHAGPIDNSAVAEALTSILIFLNKRYGLLHAGIKISSGDDPQ